VKELPETIAARMARHQVNAQDVGAGASALDPVARPFGEYTLRRRLGRSQRMSVWLGDALRLEQEVLVMIAQRSVSGAMAVQDWLLNTRQAARVTHPHLAHPIEASVHEHQAFIVFDRALGRTLPEHLAAMPVAPKPLDVVGWICQVLEGMAFAHDAGVAWSDLQLEHVLISPAGLARLMPFPSTPWDLMDSPRQGGIPAGQSASELMRGRTQANVLAVGLMLHRLLGGRPALDEPDLGMALQRLPPIGPEAVRLPTQTPHPVPQALRVIANRATAAHSPHRYLSARTFLGALQAWLDAQTEGASNPVQAVMSRAQSVGILPAQPGTADIRSALESADGCHVEALSGPILGDIALSLEVLRRVNAGRTRWGDDDAVISMRRAVALLGAKGLAECLDRMQVWPGPIDSEAASTLEQAMVKAARTAAVARSICPAGYDSEVVHLVASLHGLGRLLLNYHYPAHAEQVRQLMRPMPPQAHEPPGSASHPGLSEADAVQAVLGMSLSELGCGVVRTLGLGDELGSMLRPWENDRSPKAHVSDSDVLRAAACAANESVDAWMNLPLSQHPAAIQTICQRYGRVLEIGPTQLSEALSAAWQSLRGDGSAAASDTYRWGT
jgi:hypothetical protein